MSPELLIGCDVLTDRDVFLPLSSRMQGLYCLGKQGMGKSNFLLSLIVQDLQAGSGVCVLDPHGDLVLDVLALMPPEREDDVIFFDLQDTAHPFAFDLLAGVDPSDPSSLASGVERIVGIFKKVWGDTSWGPRLEDLLANAAYTLLANPGETLADLPTLLTNAEYRQGLIANVESHIVRSYWAVEYDPLTPRAQTGVYATLMNKIRAFLRHPVLSQIVSQPGAGVDFKELLADSKILLVRLNAELSEATELLGTAIVLRLLETALGRRHVPASERPPFLLYADEFQRFATPTFGTLLEEARKYQVGTTLAHQRRSQLTSELQDAVKGAVNTVCFQVVSDDAREMAREFSSRKRPSFLDDHNELFKWLGWNTDPWIKTTFKTLFNGTMGLWYEDTDSFPQWGSLELLLRRLIQAVQEGDERLQALPRGFILGPSDDPDIPEVLQAFNQLRNRLVALTSFDADMLVDLPVGQAAAKLRLADGMHYSLLRFPEAITKQHSATVHAIVQQDTNSPSGLPFPLLPEFVAAGQRARRIRRRRTHYPRPNGPEMPPPAQAPRTPPQTRPPEPASASLPIQFEVDID